MKPAQGSAGTSSTNRLTPMMRQYHDIKNRYPDTVLLYRMGDFYEMFHEDAKIAARVLSLTLTSRNHGGEDETPLAGFPYHALNRYANRFVKAGYKIAICEQTEDPKNAKGIVKRDVTEVITAGTALDEAFIEEKVNNFITALVCEETRAGIAICDVSTGEFTVDEIGIEYLREELARVEPTEILVARDHNRSVVSSVLNTIEKTVVSTEDGWKFSRDRGAAELCDHFHVADVESLGLSGYSSGIGAAGALLRYLKDQKRSELHHISKITRRMGAHHAELDEATIRNLELIRPLLHEDDKTTLLSVLDRTATAMGARLLRSMITHPIRNADAIAMRHDAVELFVRNVYLRGELSLLLKEISDIERGIARVVYERAHARDVFSLMQSLATFPKLIRLLRESKSDLPSLVNSICQSLGGFEEVVERIRLTIRENPPLSIRDGNIIQTGISAELDELTRISENGKAWIQRCRDTEREKTGIPSLKIGFNKVYGYYIEISGAHRDKVPDSYIRKQTLVNGERYITPELKEMEEKVLHARERLTALEYELFIQLRKEIAQECHRIQEAARAIAHCDVFVSLALCAVEYDYCRPTCVEGCDLIIQEGRHPVVERVHAGEQFIPNDAELRDNEMQIVLITGPNMAGKSTYLRQNALIALMAQMGSFVPAAAATIGLVDKFFTRIGASDRLARGQSTFLVEMIEVANILNNATDKSLVLLDEVGRGTSTFDGISIAWAVAEYLHEQPGHRARTFFATHYHELTELELIFPRLKNFHVSVKEWNDTIIFLRKIIPGSCDHSYGIQVARLAGVPALCIERAKEILHNLEAMELTPDHTPSLAKRTHDRPPPILQTSLFDGETAPGEEPALSPEVTQLLDELNALDIDSLRPLEALNLLAQLKQKAENVHSLKG